MIHVQLSTRERNESLYGTTDAIEITHLVVEEIKLEQSYCCHRIIYLHKNLRLLRKDKWTPTQLYYRVIQKRRGGGWNRSN